MTDFGRQVARFGATDVEYIVDVLRAAFTIQNASGGDGLLLDSFIAALEDCDAIEIVDDEEMLLDEA